MSHTSLLFLPLPLRGTVFFAVYLIGCYFWFGSFLLSDPHTNRHTHIKQTSIHSHRRLLAVALTGTSFQYHLEGDQKSKRQEREEGLGRYKEEEQQTSQGSYTVNQIRSVTMETDLILKTTGKGWTKRVKNVQFTEKRHWREQTTGVCACCN